MGKCSKSEGKVWGEGGVELPSLLHNPGHNVGDIIQYLSVRVVVNGAPCGRHLVGEAEKNNNEPITI